MFSTVNCDTASFTWKDDCAPTQMMVVNRSQSPQQELKNLPNTLLTK